jgi:hypothetical protein
VNSATPAILVLSLVAAALAYAATYALFVNPSTPHGKKRKQEVINGFQLAGGVLLGFALMGSLVGFTGVEFGATPSSFHVSRFFAVIIAGCALVIIGLMAQRWAKYFAGWIAWGLLNSLVMASSGHLLNNPTIPVKRSLAYTMAGLCLVTVYVTRRFTSAYKLHAMERIALLAWIVGFTLSANSNVEWFSIPALATGTLVLVFAWWWHRSEVRSRSQRIIQQSESTSGRP